MKRKSIKFISLLIFILLFAILPLNTVLSQNGGEAPKAGDEIVVEQTTIWTIILDNVLALTIVIVFLTAIINAFIKERSRDRCLKDFKDFNVTFKMKNGDTIWGNMKLYSNNIELMYNTPYYDKKDDHYEYSYILSEQELDVNIQAIHRYHWDLTPKNQKKRERSIKISYNPNIFRIFFRKVRNVINTFKDAFNKSLNLFMGQFGSKIAGGKATKELTSVGSSIIGVAGNAYDSILEKYIGKKVIAEMNENGVIKEYKGILKEYTAKYIELLNIKYRFDFEIKANKIVEIDEFSKVEFNKKDENTLQINNPTPTPILFKSISADNFEKNIGHTVKPGSNYIFELGEYKELHNLKLIFNTERFVDIIAPRTLIKIRHGGKNEKLSFSEILGLDDIPQFGKKTEEKSKGKSI